MQCFRGPPFNLQVGQGFEDGPKYFCRYDPADIYIFPAAWSLNYLFPFYFGIISTMS